MYTYGHGIALQQDRDSSRVGRVRLTSRRLGQGVVSGLVRSFIWSVVTYFAGTGNNLHS